MDIMCSFASVVFAIVRTTREMYIVLSTEFLGITYLHHLIRRYRRRGISGCIVSVMVKV